jgi:predicted transposase YbfD/YdcC
MAASKVGSIKKHFSRLHDPRVRGRSRHLLVDIVVIAICAVIGNCDDWHDIVLFAQKRESWFRRFLKLPHGIPSHDTFERVFSALDPRAFERCCLAWLREVCGLLQAGHVAIDGKTSCGSARGGRDALHLVSAWATEAQVSLGQVAVDGKSNEITAIPLLLELLDLKGALVTIDAMGCQKEIAAKVVDCGGDYLLTVKGNQERLLEDIQNTVNLALDGKLEAAQMNQWTERATNHGREETRIYTVIYDLDGIRDRHLWKGLSAVGMCYHERQVDGESVSEVRYFITSRKLRARKCGAYLRGHWGIESHLHWHLDISFGEDASRIHDERKAAAFSQLRKVALSLLKRHPSDDSMARKRKAAALDIRFLEEVLSGATKVEEV